MKQKRGNGLELRTRTGCNKCRQRRVKCPEQKPVCKPCQTLGFVCSYNKTLKWQGIEVVDTSRRQVSRRSPETFPFTPEQLVENWMFLHAFTYDFDDTCTNRDVSSDSDSEDSITDADRGTSLTTLWNTPIIKPRGSPLHSPSSHIDMNVPLWPLHLNLSTSQSFLWNYFHEAIAPACVLNPQLNPYRDVILRIAASMGNTSPLFHCIMAISASQLYVLGDRKFYQTSCDYRHQALHRLRLETAKLECTPVPATSSAHVLATVMTLVFLDILGDCSEGWVIHANFARSLIQEYRRNHSRIADADADVEALFNFVGGYIVVHEVYAHAAWNALPRDDGLITTMCDDANLQTLTGCSTDFFQILFDINSLAVDFSTYHKVPCPDPDVLLDLETRRQHLERQLHAWAPPSATADNDYANIDLSDDALAVETKRLTGLLHLYSRIDHLGPHDPCIARLTSRILALIARMPARTNTVLWPLFMTATLGVRPECDEDRAFVLEKLDSLHRMRQMRYIKKARRIIVDVWKMRDFKESTMRMGWDILQLVGQQDRISLS